MPSTPQHTPARVFLVGAGPGDPGLLTVRGASLLGRADLVLYDYLVNPQVLSHASPRSELVCLGRHGGGRIMSQQEVNERMITAARAGRSVVRLKAGDPLVFARATEECSALAAAGVPFEIVPGVTTALAAGAYAGVPVTGRQLSSAVALVTGHEETGKESAVDYAALARFPGTLVFYMGVTTVDHWSAGLMAGGLDAATPVAVIRRCTWPDQTTLRTTLGTVAREFHQRKLRPPVITIVGDVAGTEPLSDWFTARPLFGERAIVTRPRAQADDLCARLSELGADVLVQPAIEIRPLTNWGTVDAALARLSEFDWLVFSSANGVRYLLDRLLERDDARRLAGVKLAAIGPATAEELARYRLRAELVPGEYRAEGLAAALAEKVAGRRVLLARASRGRELLAEELRQAGATVEQVVVYESRDVTTADPAVAAALGTGSRPWVTVTSSAIARSLAALFGQNLHRARLASISPVTSQTLRELGYQVAAEAAVYTTSGLVDAILAG
ncbi:MAG TPA: uroporphyrinogen-III C-methyltransferase [Pirellulales bacterium]|nr:uroporphyrinogen-III C-methyltransferase [Pirellulales bacterium]